VLVTVLERQLPDALDSGARVVEAAFEQRAAARTCPP